MGRPMQSLSHVCMQETQQVWLSQYSGGGKDKEPQAEGHKVNGVEQASEGDRAPSGWGRDYITSHHEPLLPGIDEDKVGYERFVGQQNNSQIQVVGPELVLVNLYDRIGYSKIAGPSSN